MLIWAMAALVPGVEIHSMGAAFGAALVLGLLNRVLKPILSLLALPINLLTLGLFSFVINAAVLGLTAKFIGGFDIENFWAAVIGAAVLGLLTGVFHKVAPQITDAKAS